MIRLHFSTCLRRVLALLFFSHTFACMGKQFHTRINYNNRPNTGPEVQYFDDVVRGFLMKDSTLSHIFFISYLGDPTLNSIVGVRVTVYVQDEEGRLEFFGEYSGEQVGLYPGTKEEAKKVTDFELVVPDPDPGEGVYGQQYAQQYG